jgi:hypothetical protein
LLRGDAEVLRQQLPAPADRVLLEVVAEREVAEHLEERVVAVGEADVVEVVVLAAGAEAALDADGAGVGPRVATEERVLELDHARVGEQQGRVVGRAPATRTARWRAAAPAKKSRKRRRISWARGGRGDMAPGRILDLVSRVAAA